MSIVPFESAVSITIAMLLADTGVTDRVGERIYPIQSPQQASPEQIVVNLIGETDEELLAGAAQYPEARVSVECRSLNPSFAVEIGEAVIRALRDKHNAPCRGFLVTFRKAGTDDTSGSSEAGTNGFSEVSRRILDFYCRRHGAQ